MPHVLRNVVFDEDIDVQDLSQLVLQSGKIPNGSYMFDFKLRDSNGDIIDIESRTIDIYEPSFLELVFSLTKHHSTFTTYVSCDRLWWLSF